MTQLIKSSLKCIKCCEFQSNMTLSLLFWRRNTASYHSSWQQTGNRGLESNQRWSMQSNVKKAPVTGNGCHLKLMINWQVLNEFSQSAQHNTISLLRISALHTHSTVPSHN